MRFIAILATFPVFNAIALAAGGFIGSCDTCSLLNDHTLECRCQTNNSKNHAVTSLDLNQCITNNNGVLVATPNGDFGGSCSGSRLAGTTLSSNCGSGTTSINLSN
ncbi:hypothetical protein DM02DRAFT_663344 [Periconia macrospinosa]|uniref:Cyanovirin-N domain-containing protein n=1 Tax=Periconia macrospinosa TaxID=97972 RepID=A0A2V1D1Z5_9PLEO|nr:hypothetical protein DM02DRAFT_663344 [Periconia macrospinosa]